MRDDDTLNYVRTPPLVSAHSTIPIASPPPSHPRSSQPQARIPFGPLSRSYDIAYFPRDVRRAGRTDSIPIEASFSPRIQASLAPRDVARPAAIDVPLLKPIDGTFKNPDVARYDPSGLRSSMTANTVAMDRELRTNRENHLPRPAWLNRRDTPAWAAAQPTPSAGRGATKRIAPWAYTRE